MTRYARSGSTQKHRKLPGDATPWEQMKIRFPHGNSEEVREENSGVSNKRKQESHVHNPSLQDVADFQSDRIAGKKIKSDHNLDKAFDMAIPTKHSNRYFDTPIIDDKKPSSADGYADELKLVTSFGLQKNINNQAEFCKLWDKTILDSTSQADTDNNEQTDVKLKDKNGEASTATLSKRQLKKLKKKAKLQEMKSIETLSPTKTVTIKKEVVNVVEENNMPMNPSRKGFKEQKTNQNRLFMKVKVSENETEISQNEVKLNIIKKEIDYPMKEIVSETISPEKLSKKQRKLMNKKHKLLQMDIKTEPGENSSPNCEKAESLELSPYDIIYSIESNNDQRVASTEELSDYNSVLNLENLKQPTLANEQICNFKSEQYVEECDSVKNIKEWPPKKLTKNQKRKLQRQRKLQQTDALKHNPHEKMPFRPNRKGENEPISLPLHFEEKLLNYKRRLTINGRSDDKIQALLEKERRNFQKVYMRAIAEKPCYNCRQFGHLLVDCPSNRNSEKKETGLCFKCGSEQHTSSKCSQNVKGYPFAKCFICKEQGHISRDCPQNDHGIYVSGGKCSFCGNVNHLKKDCPSFKKKGAEKGVLLSAYTIGKSASVDAEIIEENVDDNVPLKKQSVKVVKF